MSAESRVVDKRKERFEFGKQNAVALKDFPSMLDADFRAIEQLVGFTDSTYRCNGKIFAFESDDIDASWSSRKAFGQHEWWHVLKNSRETAYKAIAADRSKVMDSDSATQGRIMFDSNMPPEHNGIGHDDAVLNDTIMSNVRICHEVAVMADGSNPLVFFGASIDGDAFTENVGISDHDLRWRALIGQILGLSSDNTPWKKSIVSTDRRVAC